MSTKKTAKTRPKGPVQFSTAYWADERVPNLKALLEPHGIDVDTFSQWLGPLLGNYRGYTQVRDALEPPASVAAKSLADLINALQATSAELRPNRRPAIVDANLATAALRAEIDLHALIGRLRDDSGVLAILAMQVRKALQARPSKTGAKPKTARNALLALIVQRLRDGMCTAEVARELAEQILVLSGVPVPQGERAIRRAATGGQKLPKS